MIDDMIRQQTAVARVGDYERRRLDGSFKFDAYVLRYAGRFAAGGFAIGLGVAGSLLLIASIWRPDTFATWHAVALPLLVGLIGFGMALTWSLYDQIKAYDGFNQQAYSDRMSFIHGDQASPTSRAIPVNGKQPRLVEVDHPGKEVADGGQTYHLAGPLVLHMLDALAAGDRKITRDKFKTIEGRSYFSGPAWQRLATTPGSPGTGLMARLGYWNSDNEWTPEGETWLRR
jgi:hypothetical protein